LWLKKRYDKKIISPLSFFEVFGSGIRIRDPGSGMGKKSGSGINIPDPPGINILRKRGREGE
jgi:hypothetical protein